MDSIKSFKKQQDGGLDLIEFVRFHRLWVMEKRLNDGIARPLTPRASSGSG
jgi:hypothetical protein